MATATDHVFYRDLRNTYPPVDRGEGAYIYGATILEGMRPAGQV